MKPVPGVIAGAMLTALLFGAVLITAIAVGAGGFDGPTVIVNGEPLVAASFAGVVGVAIALAVVLVVAAVVLPLALLLPLCIVAVALGLALLAIAGALMVAFSPLLALVAVIWLIARLARRKPSAGNATIAR